MNYINFVNDLVRKKVLENKGVILFGQNINAGSCLSGLTRGLQVKQSSMIINTPNSENTLCGIGFGLMMGGVDAIFFMKQLDFLILGIDHLVNTYNCIRRTEPKASFTIMPCIVDNGYQGLQSSFNNLGDICSLARIKGFTITNKVDAERIINAELTTPGFRIIGISIRLFKEEIIEPGLVWASPDNTIFQYTKGNDATIACFNLAFPYGHELCKKMGERGLSASLFSVNLATPTNWDQIIEDVKRTGRIIIIDDSKSETLPCHALLSTALESCKVKRQIIITKDMSNDWLSPNQDTLNIQYESIINRIIG